MRFPPAIRVLACLCCAAFSGCTMFPSWIQPASWWKLNQQPAGGRDSMYFSIADPPRPVDAGGAEASAEAFDRPDR